MMLATVAMYSYIIFYPYAAAAAKSLQSCPTLCDPYSSDQSGGLTPLSDTGVLHMFSEPEFLHQ